MRMVFGLLGIVFVALSVSYLFLGLQIDLLSPPISAGEPLRLARANMYVHVAIAYFGAGVAPLAHARR